MAFPSCKAVDGEGDEVGVRTARDSWIQEPYTDEEYLSYTTQQQHPGNGVCPEASDNREIIRYSVARTRRAYCTVTPPSCVYSVNVDMRQAYAGSDLNRGSYSSGGEISPYKFSTDS